MGNLRSVSQAVRTVAADTGHHVLVTSRPNEVRAAERRTIETALKKGLHPRAEISEPDQAARFLEMGVRHFCIGWDVTILHAAWRANGDGMRALLESAATPASGRRRRAAKKGNYG